MDSRKRTAHLAGILYLIVVITGFFSIAYVPSQLIVWNNAAATFSNIVASETLFRLGVLAGIICYTTFLFLPVALYKLLHPINKMFATAMVILALASVPVSLISLLHKSAVLTLISKADYLNAFDADQLQAQVLLQLEYYNNGIEIASVFWGLWLFPFGYLVIKSGFLPKFLGMFLIAGCFGYIINIIGGFLFPAYSSLGISGYVSIPSAIGEIGMCLWLLFIGVREKKSLS